MQSTSQSGLTANIGRGILAGVAGTVVMTAFQKFIEMPITGRGDSYAPADFAERVLPVSPSTPQGRTQLNYVTTSPSAGCGAPPTASLPTPG